MSELAVHIVPQDAGPQRLSDYVHQAFEHIPSRKGGKKSIQRGEILVDGVPGTTGIWVRPGMRLHWEPRPVSVEPYQLTIPVIYEDQHLAVVNKPAGMVTSGNRFKTLVNVAAYNLHTAPLPDALAQPMPVHRLDYHTSGLVLFAKTRQAQVALGEQLARQQVHKEYRAIVAGRTPSHGWLDTSIADKSALTHYQRVATFPSLKSGSISSLLLQPITGRTHQLRLHLAEAGHPILGDKQYGQQGSILKGKGLFLCATGISFSHPITSLPIQLHISPPLKFFTHVHREKRRWKKYYS